MSFEGNMQPRFSTPSVETTENKAEMSDAERLAEEKALEAQLLLDCGHRAFREIQGLVADERTRNAKRAELIKVDNSMAKRGVVQHGDLSFRADRPLNETGDYIAAVEKFVVEQRKKAEQLPEASNEDVARMVAEQSYISTVDNKPHKVTETNWKRHLLTDFKETPLIHADEALRALLGFAQSALEAGEREVYEEAYKKYKELGGTDQ